jgi:hypothetical protein
MSRRTLMLVCVFAAAGCHSRAPEPPRVTTLGAELDDAAVTASALVFDPPVAAGGPDLQLSRADREPRVAVGYEEAVVERFYVRTDDRQITNGQWGHGLGRGGSGGGVYDRYERRAVTERTGVRYR